MLAALSVGLLLCCILKNLAAAVDPVATELKVELVDGGRLISSQPEDSLTFQTEFGSIKVGWERMRSLRFSSGTNQCQLRLTNGDHLTVRLEAESLALTTLLGKLTVPVRHLARVDVSDPRAFPVGLVLHYSFAGKEGDRIIDESGNGHSGQRKEIKSTTGPGQRAGIKLDDVNSGVIVGNPAKLQLQDFILACWAKRTDLQQVNVNEMGGCLIAYGAGGFAFGVFPNGQICLSQVDANTSQRSYPEFRLTDDRWHHLAVTKNGSEVVYCVDGIVYQARPINSTFVFNTQLAIGRRGDQPNHGSDSFLGSLADVMIFDRPLTPDQLKQLYQRSK